MFIRRSIYEQLLDRVETYRQAELRARRALAKLLGSSRYTTHERLDRILRACARYRQEAAVLQRRIRHLEARLDDAMGLNQAGVAEGARWQERRHDKPRQGVSA